MEPGTDDKLLPLSSLGRSAPFSHTCKATNRTTQENVVPAADIASWNTNGVMSGFNIPLRPVLVIICMRHPVIKIRSRFSKERKIFERYAPEPLAHIVDTLQHG